MCIESSVLEYRLFLHSLSLQTIDKRAETSVQVLALRLLFNMLRRTSPYLSNMSISSAYDVVTRCLTSPHAAISLELIEVRSMFESVWKAKYLVTHTAKSCSGLAMKIEN